MEYKSKKRKRQRKKPKLQRQIEAFLEDYEECLKEIMYQYGGDLQKELDPQDNENWLGDGWIEDVTLNMTDPEKSIEYERN